jgi:hypothetical protein
MIVFKRSMKIFSTFSAKDFFNALQVLLDQGVLSYHVRLVFVCRQYTYPRGTDSLLPASLNSLLEPDMIANSTVAVPSQAPSPSFPTYSIRPRNFFTFI